MKLDVNYYNLIEGIKKIKSGLNLTEEERTTVLKLFDATCGEYFPTESELKKQEKNMEKLDKIDFCQQPILWNTIMHECSEFESKYC